jgi:acyl-CoA dehydrogenase
MRDRSYLDWPFFEAKHRTLADRLDVWAARHVPGLIDHHDIDGSCRALVAALGRDGWLEHAVPSGGKFDLRSLCLIRESLAYHAALADFAFAMQGLGTGAITLFGSQAQKERLLNGARGGRELTAFALSEPEAGSDVAAMQTAAAQMDGGFVLNGTKSWISNGGIAGQYVVFARDQGRHTAFVVASDDPGFSVAERVETISPHPLATLRFENCRVNEEAVIGGRGNGMRVALSTLDVFRPSVGAAALGLARRAFAESLARAESRAMFGGRLGDLQLVQAKLADMALKIDAAALLVYRAAWVKDVTGANRITREAAMAKLFSTEAAQEIIDDAVQLWGAAGVAAGAVVEELYRDIRAMRIYEGASDVQKIVIARSLRDGAGEAKKGSA